MRKFGFFLAGAGLVWALYAFNIDTTVSTESYYGGGFSRVHNLGLMDDRRNHLLAAGFTALIGVVLIGFGSVTSIPAKNNRLSPTQEKEMTDLGITFENGLYHFGEYEYESLSQAIMHAKASKPRSESPVV